MSKIDVVRKAMMDALKAGDKPRKEALSLLLSALKAKNIDKRADLTEDEENAVVYKEIKEAQETLDTMRRKLEERYPGVQVVGMMSPPFRELTPQEDAAVVEEINAAAPDFVWVGLGAPKQERWMAAHEDRVHALMIGVGAAFDYEAGNIQRAPMWMQKHNLEWLYRLLQDPKRLFKRYLNTNLKYILWTWRHDGA